MLQLMNELADYTKTKYNRSVIPANDVMPHLLPWHQRLFHQVPLLDWSVLHESQGPSHGKAAQLQFPAHVCHGEPWYDLSSERFRCSRVRLMNLRQMRGFCVICSC